MERFLLVVVLGCLGSLALAGVASASGGLPQPSTTRQLPGVPCSVTAYGLAFSGQGKNLSMNYAGGLSCSGGTGQKTIDVVPQVFNVVNGHQLWFSIGAAGLYQGPTPASPLRVSGSASAVASHIYRLVVFARVTMPDGRTSVDDGVLGLLGPRLRPAADADDLPARHPDARPAEVSGHEGPAERRVLRSLRVRDRVQHRQQLVRDELRRQHGLQRHDRPGEHEDLHADEQPFGWKVGLVHSLRIVPFPDAHLGQTTCTSVQRERPTSATATGSWSPERRRYPRAQGPSRLRCTATRSRRNRVFTHAGGVRGEFGWPRTRRH